MEPIREVIGALLRNNNIVLLPGGLGPTHDDMTRSALQKPLEWNL